MGLKYHLGHTGYLQRNPSDKIFLTKSSISLNKLADLAYAAENIEFKLNSIKEDTLNQNNLQQDWLKRVDVNFAFLNRVTKKNKSRPATMSNVQSRKVYIESAAPTLRLFNPGQDQLGRNESHRGNEIKITLTNNDNLHLDSKGDINFEDFKSNLDQKTTSMFKESYGVKTQLRIVASASDLPPEKRERFINKFQSKAVLSTQSNAATPNTAQSRQSNFALGGFSGAVTKGPGDLAKSTLNLNCL